MRETGNEGVREETREPLGKKGGNGFTGCDLRRKAFLLLFIRSVRPRAWTQAVGSFSAELRGGCGQHLSPRPLPDSTPADQRPQPGAPPPFPPARRLREPTT